MRSARLPERIEGYALFARFAWVMTSIAFALPPNIVNRKRKCSDASNQQPLYQRLRSEVDGPTSGVSDGGSRTSQPSSEDEGDNDNDDACVDPSSVLDFGRTRDGTSGSTVS